VCVWLVCVHRRRRLDTSHNTHPTPQDRLCDAMTSQLGGFSADCPCKVELSGFFDFDVDIGCNDIGGTMCDLKLGAGGNILFSIFNGVTFSGDTSCSFPPATITVGLDGTVKLDGAKLDDCDFGLAVTGLPSGAATPVCTCNAGCNPAQPFFVQVGCTVVLPAPLGTQPLLNLPCQNALGIFDAVGGVTIPTFP
jgi:hypothetical protein